jgi:hypothetical protein
MNGICSETVAVQLFGGSLLLLRLFNAMLLCMPALTLMANHHLVSQDNLSSVAAVSSSDFTAVDLGHCCPVHDQATACKSLRSNRLQATIVIMHRFVQ